jgi:hypothetical protein
MTTKTTNSKKLKDDLRYGLEKLIGEAERQNELHEGARQLLYRTLAEVYAWWLNAAKIDGFLDELYSDYGLRTNATEENFTRLIRLVWQVDWNGRKGPALQVWSKALRKIDHEYKADREKFEGNVVGAIVQLINARGGLRGVIGEKRELQDNESDFVVNVNSKKSGAKNDSLSESKLKEEHLRIGKEDFDKTKPIQTFKQPKEFLPTNKSGYAVALIRKNSTSGYNILSVSNDQELIDFAVLATYKRHTNHVSHLLHTICEVIQTQAFPKQLETHRKILAELSKFESEDGKKMRQIKRILILPKSKEIILSETRTFCSVVTIAKPKIFPSGLTKNVFLRTENHKYIEQEIIQRNDLCFYTVFSEKIETVKDEEIVASKRIRIKNKITNRIKNLFFYDYDESIGEKGSQAFLIEQRRSFNWTAKASANWFKEIEGSFVSNWLEGFGKRINHPKNKLIRLSVTKNGFTISYSGSRDHLDEHEVIKTPLISQSKAHLHQLFQSKDLIPVLHSIANKEIVGNVSLSINEDLLLIKYSTKIASYLIAVPTANFRGRRIPNAFQFYGAANGN